MLKSSRYAATAFMFLSIAMAAFSQPPLAKPTAGDRAIHLDVVVTTKSGDPVGELRQQEFTLLDNKTPQPITSFRALGGDHDPTEVILLVDAVNASYQAIAYERGELDKFLRADGGHLALPTSLAIFKDTGTEMQQGFSQDGNALSSDLDKYAIGLRDIRRSSGIYGADERLQLSLNTLRRLAAQEAGRPGRKLILWVSPGWPLLSGPGIQLDAKQQQSLFATIVDLSTALRQANVTLYSVDSLGVSEPLSRVLYYQEFLKGVSKPNQVVIGDLGLQVLAVQSGGLALNSTDLNASLQKCVADTRNYYELTFTPGRPGQTDEYHHLEVHLATSGLTARTRQGYYIQP